VWQALLAVCCVVVASVCSVQFTKRSEGLVAVVLVVVVAVVLVVVVVVVVVSVVVVVVVHASIGVTGNHPRSS
jgi:hypothetical protein